MVDGLGRGEASDMFGNASYGGTLVATLHVLFDCTVQIKGGEVAREDLLQLMGRRVTRFDMDRGKDGLYH